MKIEKLLINLFTLLTLYLNTGSAWAVENAEDSGSPYWPLIVLLAVLIIFRKKLIAEATVQKHDIGLSDEEKVPQQEEKKLSGDNSEDVIDLTQNVEQCQGTTAKGSRCSRSSNLAPVIVSIENKKYQFLSCKQHNNDDFTPFHFR